MMKSFHKPITLLMLLTLVISALTLNGCESALINNGLHRTECELYVNALLNEDFEAAHAVTPALSKEEHRPYFETCRKSFEGATSYELTQTGWNINTSNGVTARTAAYQIVTDTGVTCQITLQSTDSTEGITYIYFQDSTEFIESTKNVGSINIGLMAGSVLLMGFTVWMLIDCIKRKLSQKILWIIVLLLSLSLSFSIGEGSFHQSFMLTLFIEPWSLEAILPNQTVTLTVVLPVGSLIYCFMRKKLSQKYAEKMEAATAASAPMDTPATVQDLTPATVADLAPTLQAPAEEAPATDTPASTPEESGTPSDAE